MEQQVVVTAKAAGHVVKAKDITPVEEQEQNNG